VPAANQPVARARVTQLRKQALHIGQHLGLGDINALLGGSQALGQLGFEGTKIDTRRLRPQCFQVEAVFRPVPVGAGPESEINDGVGWHGRSGLQFQGRSDSLTQGLENLPVMQGAFWLVEHRLVVARGVAQGVHMESEVVVIVFQWRGGGQDDVSVPCGFVDPGIQGHHEVELLQSLIQVLPRRGRQHRVASAGKQGTNLPLTRGGDLLGQAGHGQFAIKFG